MDSKCSLAVKTDSLQHNLIMRQFVVWLPKTMFTQVNWHLLGISMLIAESLQKLQVMLLPVLLLYNYLLSGRIYCVDHQYLESKYLIIR